MGFQHVGAVFFIAESGLLVAVDGEAEHFAGLVFHRRELVKDVVSSRVRVNGKEYEDGRIDNNKVNTSLALDMVIIKRKFSTRLKMRFFLVSNKRETDEFAVWSNEARNAREEISDEEILPAYPHTHERSPQGPAPHRTAARDHIYISSPNPPENHPHGTTRDIRRASLPARGDGYRDLRSFATIPSLTRHRTP